ncbi:MAG: hypothetical protein GX957_10045 [Clostridiaceae bacterium]|nr:hypothetical protein [Clostridiaceae bacterium]
MDIVNSERTDLIDKANRDSKIIQQNMPAILSTGALSAKDMGKT